MGLMFICKFCSPDYRPSAKPKGVRLGYMGHLTLISEDVTTAFSHYPPELLAILSEFTPQPAWDNYLAGRFREAKERDERALGGGRPVVAAAPGAKSEAAGVFGRVDEADKIPVPITGVVRGPVVPVPTNGNGNSNGSGPMNGVEPTPPLTGPTPRTQNVVFATKNEGEEVIESDQVRSAIFVI